MIPGLPGIAARGPRNFYPLRAGAAISIGTNYRAGFSRGFSTGFARARGARLILRHQPSLSAGITFEATGQPGGYFRMGGTANITIGAAGQSRGNWTTGGAAGIAIDATGYMPVRMKGSAGIEMAATGALATNLKMAGGASMSMEGAGRMTMATTMDGAGTITITATGFTLGAAFSAGFSKGFR